jgi:hypothetical protein
VNIILTTELVVGVFTVVGTLILALSKFGLITFGKPKCELPERRDCAKQCADHEKVVRDAALAVKESKLTSNRLAGDIASLKEATRDIKNTLEQRDYNNQSEFRRIRELIGDLSGYIRGVHEHRKHPKQDD